MKIDIKEVSLPSRLTAAVHSSAKNRQIVVVQPGEYAVKAYHEEPNEETVVVLRSPAGNDLPPLVAGTTYGPTELGTAILSN